MNNWTQTCANLANQHCATCLPPPACGAAGTGSCCSANGTPFCNNATCCNVVCDIDPYCCDPEGEWNECCADLANEICVGPVPGRDPDPDAPPGPCTGYCGEQSPQGCWCDNSCCVFADCCSDKATTCEPCGPPEMGACEPASCAGFCGAQHPSGCWCDESCNFLPNNCCADFCMHCTCDMGFSTCAEGVCGVTSMLCSCAPTCTIGLTCCPDICQTCGHPDCNPADVTGDNIANIFDLLFVLSAWGECPGFGTHCPDPNDCPADVNKDGVVNIFDVLFVLANWG